MSESIISRLLTLLQVYVKQSRGHPKTRVFLIHSSIHSFSSFIGGWGPNVSLTRICGGLCRFLTPGSTTWPENDPISGRRSLGSSSCNPFFGGHVCTRPQYLTIDSNARGYPKIGEDFFREVTGSADGPLGPNTLNNHPAVFWSDALPIFYTLVCLDSTGSTGCGSAAPEWGSPGYFSYFLLFGKCFTETLSHSNRSMHVRTNRSKWIPLLYWPNR